jgi:ferritin heavy chain
MHLEQFKSIYFGRDDVALHGFSKFFKHNSDEERDHAEKFMKYQNRRGGSVVFKDVLKPEKFEWSSGLEALEAALDLEKKVNQALLDIHGVGRAKNDAHFCDFIESEFLNEQVEAIKDLGDKITRAKRAGPGLGEFLFDKEFT